MTRVTCRLTAKNREDQLRNPTLGNRVWASFTFFTLCSTRHCVHSPRSSHHQRCDGTTVDCNDAHTEVAYYYCPTRPGVGARLTEPCQRILTRLVPEPISAEKPKTHFLYLWAYYNCDTSTIRLRFEYDTTSYEELCAFEQ